MKKLFNNIGLKILALLAAVVLWLVIMVYADPNVTRVIDDIPITLVNTEIISSAGKAYRVESSLLASVRVTAANSIARTLSASDFEARADISAMYDLTGRVPVTVSCRESQPDGVEIVPLTESVQIAVESILTKTIAITLETSGTIADGYLMGDISVNPARVKVRAPESVIEKIARVACSIDISGLSEPAEYETDIVLYSESGMPLYFTEADGFSISATKTTVSTEILSVKTLPIVYDVTGKDAVAAGYRFTGAELSALSVQVSGLKSRLAQVSALTIPEGSLDVTGAQGNVVKELKLEDYLPDSLSVVAESDKVLKVTLKVEPLTSQMLDVASSIELVGAAEGYEYVIKDTSVRLFFRALKDDFTHFSASQVKVSLDVSGLEPGSYLLPLSVTVEDDVFELAAVPDVNIEIVDPNASEEDEEAEEAA